MSKHTKKDYYTNIINLIDGKEFNIEEKELIDFCKREIDMLDEKAARARAAAEKKKEVGDPLLDIVYSALTPEPQLISDITITVNETANLEEQITSAKVIYRLTVLVNEGKAIKNITTIEGHQLVTYAKI